ncbi:MAG: SigB/SigF/SigG family RNA polymerase sigma factor [Erysipelotrichia bacterium]|nr:SigB/SigF/SigG family RNA polymerase sigma factor [Erysipelotrichia bacterium]NCC54786.1 SigB/SigF/SigG family RNA polymerase sigma factor [Erysipelotrichia bacterium]
MSRYKVDITGVNTADLIVLKNDEMYALFTSLQQNHDLSAKEKLINGNLKLVLSLVQRFSNRTDNMDDLFQVGCIGLIKAIDHFDLSHEVRFSTYAVPMIMGEMKRYLRDYQSIKVARHLKDVSYKEYQLKEEYMHTHEKEPDVAYLAKVLEVSEKDVVDALGSMNAVISIFEPIYNSDGDEMFLLDQIKDDKDEATNIHNLLTLHKSMEHLDKKELNIIQKRYYDDMTQNEIANELGISQAQVSRLEKNALMHLKKQFNM